MLVHRDDRGPPHPMPGDALGRLADEQRAICTAVEQLLAAVGAGGRDDAISRCAGQARRLLDEQAPQLHAIEERHLFTPLIESMAGSDPVCLRELTAALSDEHRLLQARWRALRPGIVQLCDGGTLPIDRQALAELAAAWRAHLARQQAELLPMAARLLDDTALVAIARALDAVPRDRWRQGQTHDEHLF